VRFHALVGLFVTLSVVQAAAQTMYRCSEGGKTVYQGTPCASGTEKRIAADGGPTREDVERARMRAHAAQQAEDDQLRARAVESARQSEQQERANAIAAQNRDQMEKRKLEDEKVTVHGPSGWDRKPRGQLEAEARAVAAGRAAGSGTGERPVISEASSADKGAWQNEKVMEHGPNGWTQRTRGEQVQRKANSSYGAARNPPPPPPSVPTMPAVPPAMVQDQFGRQWINQGATVVSPRTGRVCVQAGNQIIC